MDHQQQLRDYIHLQIQAGLDPNEITQQLRTAGWDEAPIAGAFKDVRASLYPSAAPKEPAAQPSPATQAQSNQLLQATGKKRGRLKTAWLLLKQSFKVLSNNKHLVRYPFMGGLITLLIAVIFVIIIFATGDTFVYNAKDIFGDEEVYFTPQGMALLFAYYVIAFFVISIYNAGLAAHTLDIFRGKSGSYKSYMGLAWSKRNPIFVYAAITATVGLILQFIEQRFKILGYIVSRVLGALWSLANLFTIPIIAESNVSAPRAIKESTQLFVSRWGENIGARIGFGGLALLFYLLVAFPLFAILIAVGASLGSIGIVVGLILIVILLIAFITIETAASNILSTALYFYARYSQIPAAFDQDLLNAVFIPKKKRRWFKGKKSA